ncbi:uncharacterized protein LOC130761974 [Actinidia eriantha]|uniref:uncharacterized protein LOC130761974 n=1 Tax=Actinidia eriantha TaxID=165200 RepID=UPI0025906557|nr:uncharacterized protein LOC130761974 [Actinidia eriantha]
MAPIKAVDSIFFSLHCSIDQMLFNWRLDAGMSSTVRERHLALWIFKSSRGRIENHQRVVLFQLLDPTSAWMNKIIFHEVVFGLEIAPSSALGSFHACNFWDERENGGLTCETVKFGMWISVRLKRTTTLTNDRSIQFRDKLHYTPLSKFLLCILLHVIMSFDIP